MKKKIIPNNQSILNIFKFENSSWSLGEQWSSRLHSLSFSNGFITLYKKSTHLVKPFLKHSILENRAIWLDNSILSHNLRTRFFPDAISLNCVQHVAASLSAKKSIHLGTRFWKKTWKSWFLANFWHFFQSFGKIRFFFLKNPVPSDSNCSQPRTSCKKSDISYDSILRKIRTDVRTDGSEFIGPSRERGSNKRLFT